MPAFVVAPIFYMLVVGAALSAGISFYRFFHSFGKGVDAATRKTEEAVRAIGAAVLMLCIVVVSYNVVDAAQRKEFFGVGGAALAIFSILIYAMQAVRTGKGKRGSFVGKMQQHMWKVAVVPAVVMAVLSLVLLVLVPTGGEAGKAPADAVAMRFAGWWTVWWVGSGILLKKDIFTASYVAAATVLAAASLLFFYMVTSFASNSQLIISGIALVYGALAYLEYRGEFD